MKYKSNKILIQEGFEPVKSNLLKNSSVLLNIPGTKVSLKAFPKLPVIKTRNYATNKYYSFTS